LPVNDEKITLVREPQLVPEVIETAGGAVVPWHAGQTLSWRLAP
jgi:dihydroorotase